MPLGDPTAPEGIGFALREDAFSKDPLEREHTWVPAAGDKSSSASFFGNLVYIGKVLWDAGVCIEGVDAGKVLGDSRSLVDQIGSRAAAQDHDVDFALEGFYLIHGVGGNARKGLNTRTTGEYPY